MDEACFDFSSIKLEVLVSKNLSVSWYTIIIYYTFQIPPYVQQVFVSSDHLWVSVVMLLIHYVGNILWNHIWPTKASFSVCYINVCNTIRVVFGSSKYLQSVLSLKVKSHTSKNSVFLSCELLTAIVQRFNRKAFTFVSRN